MMNATLRGKPNAGNPHVRFDEGEVASVKPRRGSLLYMNVAPKGNHEAGVPHSRLEAREAVLEKSRRRAHLCKNVSLEGGASLRCRLMALAASLAVESVFAAQTTISEPTTLSVAQGETSNWCPLKLNADLDIVSGGKLYAHWANTIYLPGEAGKDVDLRLSGTGKIEFYYTEPGNPNYMHIGKNGGKGHVICEGTEHNFLNRVNVWPGAEVDASGYVDYLCVSGGSFRASHYITNASPVRVTMAGGMLYVPKSATGIVRDLFNVGPGSKLVLASADGADMLIGLNQGDKHPWINFNVGDGAFETTGTGNLYFGKTGGASVHVCFLMGPDRATWGHSGKTILRDNATFVVGCDQALPHGPNTGVIMFSSQNQAQPKFIDLNGHTTQVNGLEYEEWDDTVCSFITNSCETAEGVLQFGGLNDNARLDYARFRGNVVLEKIGTGTLTISSGDFVRLRATSGKLIVGGNHTLETIEIGAGATVEVQGAVLTVGKIVNNGGVLTFTNSGRIVNADCVYEQTIDTSMMPSKWTRFDVMDYGYAAAGLPPTHLSVIKKNTDTFTCFDTGAALGAVDVQSGRLRFGGAVDTSHYGFWRLSVRKTLGSFSRKSSADETYSTMRAGLARWWLTTADLAGTDATKGSCGPSLNQWGTTVETGTAPKDLAEGQWTSGKKHTGRDYGGGAVWGAVSNLGRPFYDNSFEWYYSCVFSNDQPDPAVPSTWETVAMRLSSASTKTVGGYLLALAANVNNDTCHLVSWTVEASADGITWEKMDDRENFKPYETRNGQWYNHGNLFLFNQKSAGWTFRPQGVVTVAKDAILDLDEIPEANIALSRLTVDQTAGAGTITVFAPAATGELRLENVPTAQVDAEGQLLARTPVAITIGKSVGADKLKSWRVMVNGVEQKLCKPFITANGQLAVNSGKGFVIVVR